MKHAFLVTAYNNFENLNRLLELLDDERSVVFLHIDAKAGTNTRQLVRSMSAARLEFVPPIRISWGGVSLIECILNLLEYALGYEWEYCHYLTESDLPLKTMDEIDCIFEKHYGYEFVDFAPENYEFSHYKCDVYHCFTKFPAYRTSKILKILNHGLARLQWILGIRRGSEDLKHGSAYFSISREFAAYLVERRAHVMKRYLHSLAADEVWLQTLCESSPFRDKVLYYEQKYFGNLRLIDWSRRNGNSPYTFQQSDYPELIEWVENSELCFARKFEANSEAARQLHQYLRFRENRYE